MLASAFVTIGAGSMAASGETAAPAMIEDIRIGERGMQTRIALFCRAACEPLSMGDGEYFLAGAGDNFDIDISSASERVQRMIATPEPRGALIQIDFDGNLGRATANACTVGGKKAACLDLYFFEQAEPEPEPSEPTVAGAPLTAAPEPAAAAASASVPAPTLREAAGDRYGAFSHLAKPERLAPPILAKVQPIEKAIEVATPSLRPTESLARQVEQSFAGRIETLLGKSLTAAYCNNAEATLRTDAWALGAMVDVGLCAAARGDATEGEAILSRLLEYTPDNYEALVGKAVIAEQAGERGAALRYYQEALDAAAPVRESARIVEAMAALT